MKTSSRIRQWSINTHPNNKNFLNDSLECSCSSTRVLSQIDRRRLFQWWHMSHRRQLLVLRLFLNSCHNFHGSLVCLHLCIYQASWGCVVLWANRRPIAKIQELGRNRCARVSKLLSIEKRKQDNDEHERENGGLENTLPMLHITNASCIHTQKTTDEREREKYHSYDGECVDGACRLFA